MASSFSNIESRCRAATRSLDASHRSRFGQFFTPESVAQFMASLVKRPQGTKRLSILDPGAGIGSLSAALLAQLHGRGDVTAYELEPSFQDDLKATLHAFPGKHVTLQRDFIEQAVLSVATGKVQGGLFDAVIANPPYKKTNTDSVHRLLLDDT